jgi:hypothetical protein
MNPTATRGKEVMKPALTVTVLTFVASSGALAHAT